MSFISGTKPALALSYSFGNMIIMKRIFLSLSVVRTSHQAATLIYCRYLYIEAWTAPGLESCQATVSFGPPRVAVLLTSRTGRRGIDTRFAYFFGRLSPPVNPFQQAVCPAMPDRS